MFRHIFFILILISYNSVSCNGYLSIVQLNYVRNILINPNTRSDIRIKTKEILYIEYQGWLKKQVDKFIEINNLSNNSITTVELHQCASKGFLTAIDNYNGDISLTLYAKEYIINEMRTGLSEIKSINKY